MFEMYLFDCLKYVEFTKFKLLNFCDHLGNKSLSSRFFRVELFGVNTREAESSSEENKIFCGMLPCTGAAS